MKSSEPARRVPLSVWLLLVAWVALTAAAVIWGIPNEENDLTARTVATLNNEGVQVEFAGRDAHLSGTLASDADLDRAVATVRTVRGVRRVHVSDIAVADDGSGVTVSELSPPAVSIDIADDVVTISGVVPDEATVLAIMQAAQSRWGADNVVNRLSVGGTTEGARWLPGLVPALASLSEIEQGSLTISGDGAVLAGTALSEAAASAAESIASAALSGLASVDNQLRVVALMAPSFLAELTDGGTIRLQGVLPDQAVVDQIVAAAVAVHGSDNVVAEITIGDVASPGYLDALPGAFGVIEGLSPWRLSLEDGGVLLTGLAVSDAALDGSLEALTTVFRAAGLNIESDLEVDPTAVATVLTELLEGTATFEVGSAQLSTEATELLDRAIEILGENPTTRLTVEGHTDDVGSSEDNLALSEARAQAVVDYLVTGGVAAERLTAIGYGESRPIADNTTAEGRAENRRIEFVVEQGDR